MKVINPATLETIADLEADHEKAITEKFNRARAGQTKWAQTPFTVRAQAVRKFKELLENDKVALARILTGETGKPVTQALNEITGTLGRIDFFLNNTLNLLQEETVFQDQAQHLEEVIRQEPLGVIANISAWNYPYFVGSNVFIPALLTGNAVLYKPSEFASMTGLAISERLHAAGIPKDVFIPVIGDGKTGAELVRSPIQGIFFTGSYATGKKIAADVGSRMLKLQLELGGKDPTYVCDDVDVNAAATGLADGAFYNAGQSCCSVERIYVHNAVFDAFLDRFVKTVEGFVIGDPLDEKTYIGPLTRAAQVEVLERQCQDALDKGARLLTGGKRLKRTGNYFAPTVFTEVNHKMDVMREESFGPIIGIQRVTGDEEALKLMNDTPYGLTAGVYTAEAERAHRILANVNAGSVYWNCCDRVSPRLPWSGRGHSGMGTTLSLYGIQTFLQQKAWHLRA